MIDARPPTCVVGVDGSPGSRRALAWASAKTNRLGPVEAVLVYRVPRTLTLPGRRGSDPAFFRAAAETRLTALIADSETGPVARTRVVEGRTGPTLCDVARDGTVLVVGSQGRAAAADTIIGSVASYCAHHSPVPIVIVPPDFPSDRPLHRAVVGVDGSEQSEVALRWALDHVEPDGVVVAVGAMPAWGFTDAGMDPSPRLVEKALRHRVEESVSRIETPSPNGPALEIRVSRLDARTALREVATSSADLLVVGDRGLGTIRFLLLGSVSSALVHHPSVPTVVVR